MLGGPHRRLRAQPQSPQPALFRAPDDSEQELAPDALSLCVRCHRERADVRLRIVPRELAARLEWLEHDRAEDLVGGLVRGDEHDGVAEVAVEAESAQRLGVLTPVGQQP